MATQQAFPRVTPESVGIPSGAIDALLSNLEKGGFEPHGLMILRHGKVCAEGWWKPYGPDKLHNIHSFTKTFMATALGIVVSEGKLSLTDKVLSFFPEEAPANPSENLQAMEVRHLLTMNTGQHNEPAVRGEKEFVKAFLNWPVEHKPGTWFRYNSNASHMLGNIIYKVTGRTFMDILQQHIFQPMGFGPMECTNMADGLPAAGGGMAITTEDMARLAQLYLNRGEWNGQQLVPKEWIDAAIVPHSDNSNGTHRDGNEDWEAGYGYQIWMNQPLRSYRFDGAFGQEALLFPDQDLAIILNAATGNLGDMFRMIWRLMLDALTDEPLPENPGGYGQLKQRLASLKLPELIPQGESLLQAGVSGKRIRLAGNDLLPIAQLRLGTPPDVSQAGIDWIEPSFANGNATVNMQTKGGLYTIQAGMDGEPIANTFTVDGEEMEFQASARWTDQNVLSIALRRLRVVQTAFLTITYHLDGAEVTLQQHPRGDTKSVNGCFA